MPSPKKICTKCGKYKPRDRFSKWSRGLDGYYPQCRACRKEAYRAIPSEERSRLNRSAWLQNKWGISLEEYEAMLAAQGGGCAICGKQCPTGRALAVDHDHDTGEIRGLLCYKHNTALGLLDSIELLTAAISYLRK